MIAKKLAMYPIEIDESFSVVLDKVNPSLYADKEFVLVFLNYDRSRVDRIDASLLGDPEVRQALGE